MVLRHVMLLYAFSVADIQVERKVTGVTEKLLAMIFSRRRSMRCEIFSGGNGSSPDHSSASRVLR